MKQFESGKLKATNSKRSSVSKYPELEKKLIAYVDIRAEKYLHDKCGVSTLHLQKKVIEWAEELGLDMHQFKGSAHFISNCIKRNNRIAVNLHGEANTYEPEERKQIMDKWKKNELHPLIEKYSVPAERIYANDLKFEIRFANSTIVLWFFRPADLLLWCSDQLQTLLISSSICT